MIKRIKHNGDGPKTKLKVIIDEQVQAWNDERNAERARAGKTRSLYASDYGQCMRKCWFQFFPEQYSTPDFDPRVLRIFHNGESVHERLSLYLKQAQKLNFRDEVDVPRDVLDVHGRCDGICTVDAAPVIVEFKSINRAKVYAPKDEHVGQITWYMTMWRMLQRQVKEDFGYGPNDVVRPSDIAGVEALSGLTLDTLSDVEEWLLFAQGELRGEIIYESKQTQETFHFKVDYDESRAQKVRLWFEQLKWHVDEGEVPLVRYNKDKFPCSWKGGKCAYYSYCWSS